MYVFRTPDGRLHVQAAPNEPIQLVPEHQAEQLAPYAVQVSSLPAEADVTRSCDEPAAAWKLVVGLLATGLAYGLVAHGSAVRGLQIGLAAMAIVLLLRAVERRVSARRD